MAPPPEQIAGFLARIHLFRGIDPEKLIAAAKLFEVVELKPDAAVYAQGQEAGEFYFLYSGRVKMTRFDRQTQEERMLGFLDEADFFGWETFQENRPRQASVHAISAVTLLILDIPHARRLFDDLPELFPRFHIPLDSYNLLLKTPFSWLNPEEYAHYVARKHPLFLWARLLPWLFFGILALGIMTGLLSLQHVTVLILMFTLGLLFIVGGLIWHIIDWSNDYFVVTGRRVVYQERVILLYDSRQESPTEQIQSLSVDSSQIGRIFNYGNVTMRTFTGTIVFRAVRQPQDVVGLIQEMQKRTQSSLRQAELRQIEETLKQRFANVQPNRLPPARPAKVNARVSRIQRFMADLFHLRYEDGDTIQYRTHWWILLQRIWFQTVLLLGVISLQLWIFVRAITGQLPGFPVTGAFLGLCVAFLGIFGWWLYNYLDWHNDIYLVTGDQVMDVNRKPLGKEEKRAAQIKNILSVEYKRIGIIGLLLNFGTVYIRVGEAVFTFDDVFNPSEVQRELFHRISQRSLKERQAQTEAERQRMADWITVYHRMTKPQG
jgi:CRP-like cAMP-binding protein